MAIRRSTSDEIVKISMEDDQQVTPLLARGLVFFCGYEILKHFDGGRNVGRRCSAWWVWGDQD